MIDLKGKVALITGSARGIGKDISTEHANRIVHWASSRTPAIDVVKTKFDLQSQKLSLVPVFTAKLVS